MIFRRRASIALLAIAAVVVGVYLSADWWLYQLGAMLVRAEQPVRSDAILVLAGDRRGNRIMTACELLAKGYAPIAYVSGPTDLRFYGLNEADMAIRFAAERGCDPQKLIPTKLKVYSTEDEAVRIGEVLREQNVRSLLLVTSNFHTARAYRMFRDALGPDVRLRTVASPDRFFHPHDWWHTREGQKTWLLELSKTVASAVGL